VKKVRCFFVFRAKEKITFENLGRSWYRISSSFTCSRRSSKSCPWNYK